MPSDTPIAYRKFSRQRKSFLGTEQLWSGGDHLLLVSTIFSVESYRRFYFQDIEALVIRPTNGQRHWILANGICLLLFGGLTAAVLLRHPTEDEIVGGVFLGILAVLAFIGLLWQLALGPKCICFLQTRTSLEKFAFANRIRSSLAMRDRLAALIAASAEARAAAPVNS